MNSFVKIGPAVAKLGSASAPAGGGAKRGDIRLSPTDLGTGWLSETVQIPFQKKNDDILPSFPSALLRTHPDGNSVADMVFANGVFVTVGASGVAYRSADLITWTKFVAGWGAGATLNAIAYGAGIWVISTNGGGIWTSPDLGPTNSGTWTSRTSTFSAANILDVVFANGMFVASGGSGRIATSTDGITWTSRTNPLGTGNLTRLAYGNGMWVVVGGTVMGKSADGITWTAVTSPLSGIVGRVAFGNGLWIVSGGDGQIARSADLVTWTAIVLPGVGTGNNVNGLIYYSGVWVVAMTGPLLFVSVDAIEWLKKPAVPGSVGNVVPYGTDLIAAVGGDTLYRINITMSGYPIGAKPNGKEAWLAYTKL